MKVEERPWGFFEILFETPNYKIKQIVIYPKQKISLQSHEHRNEHWFILSGIALVQVNQHHEMMQEGESIDIQKEDIHRIENIGKDNLIFIEIQTGEYLQENDIKRLKDIYDRE